MRHLCDCLRRVETVVLIPSHYFLFWVKKGRKQIDNIFSCDALLGYDEKVGKCEANHHLKEEIYVFIDDLIGMGPKVHSF
jgi:hypothetical protein